MTVYDSVQSTSIRPTTRTLPSRLSRGILASLAGIILSPGPQARGSPDVPRWLRQDLGLPPLPGRPRYWDDFR